MALAIVDDGRLRVSSHLDERSAGFFALGAARATCKPVAVLTTSGTAAANLLPACVEARYAGIPLVFLTADRPAELAGVGASQTIDQSRLLSPARWFGELLTHEQAGPSELQRAAHLGAQSVASASDPRGPVQVNIRFREPLTPSSDARAMGLPGRFGVPRTSIPLEVPDPHAIADAAGALRHVSRGLIHCGHLESADDPFAQAVTELSLATGFPVLAEATSRLRGRLGGAVEVTTAEALVRDVGFSGPRFPGIVVRIGKAPLTRALAEWLEGVPQLLVADGLPWQDPGRDAAIVVRGDATEVCRAIATAVSEEERDADAWSADWAAAQATARTALDSHLAGGEILFEGTVASALLHGLPDGGLIYSATSLSVRAIDAFWTADRPIDVLANRGANGIDGTISAALGAAWATGRPVACLTGDLAFLHDLGGLLAVPRLKIPLVTVVIDNDGGGIFEFLPQAMGLEREVFEQLFTVSHRLDLMHAAELYEMRFAAARDRGSLEQTLRWAFTEGGAWVIRVPVERGESVTAHAQSWEAVSDALRAEL